MLSSSPALGRPADRKQKIVRELRQSIVTGTLLPGTQLPTRPEIEAHFGVSSLTVQRALEDLRKDGFVTVSGRQGTFVSKNPPHLTNYVLAFPALPSDAHWSHFWTSLSKRASSLPPSKEFRLTTYHEINGDPHSLQFQELSEEVMSHRVAGLIFAAVPTLVAGTPLLEEAGIPRVSIAIPTQNYPFPVVELSRHSFFEKALKSLAEQGRKQVAFLGRPGSFQEREWILPMLEANGLQTRSYWWQSSSISELEGAQNCTHLLMSQTQQERPDALIISDDNLVESALSGLIAAGIQWPDALSVVAHCNFPSAAPNVLPVQRLGFDTQRVLESCIDLIDRQRRGENVPHITSIEAVFEDELNHFPKFVAKEKNHV